MRTQRGVRGDTGRNDGQQLVDADNPQTPRGHRTHRAQTDTVDTPTPAVPQPQFEQGQEQYQCLDGHAQRPRAGGQHDFVRGPEAQRLLIGLAEHHNEQRESGTADDIRRDRTPRVHAEMVFRRQNLAEYGIQAVEEDLRHAPQRECIGQREHVLAAVRVQMRERGGGGGQQHHCDCDARQ